jgi:hypothetical protein
MEEIETQIETEMSHQPDEFFSKTIGSEYFNGQDRPARPSILDETISRLSNQFKSLRQTTEATIVEQNADGVYLVEMEKL